MNELIDMVKGTSEVSRISVSGNSISTDKKLDDFNPLNIDPRPEVEITRYLQEKNMIDRTQSELNSAQQKVLKEHLLKIIDNLESISTEVVQALVLMMEAFVEANTKSSQQQAMVARTLFDYVKEVANKINLQAASKLTGVVVGAAASTGLSTLGVKADASAAANAGNPTASVKGSALVQGGRTTSEMASASMGVMESKARADETNRSNEANMMRNVQGVVDDDKRSLKELKDFLLRIVQSIDENITQARDAAASIRG